jgi:GNAT superfamily N-acetyltransferase
LKLERQNAVQATIVNPHFLDDSKIQFGYPYPMEIRPLTSVDLDGLQEIDGTVQSTHYLHLDQIGEGMNVGWRIEPRSLRQKLIEPNRISDEAQFIAKQIASGADEGLALVAIHQDIVVAVLLAVPRHENKTLEVIDFRVDDEHRREGLATAMMYQSFQFARELEFRAVMTQTRTNNFPAGQFLLKCSFDLAGLDTRRSSNHDMVKESATLIWYTSME